MEKYYHFIFRGKLNKDELIEVISGVYHKEYELKIISNGTGYIKADVDFYDSLMNIHQIMEMDLDCPFTFLVSFENGELSSMALSKCNKLFPNQITNLSMIYFASLIHGEKELTNKLDAIFLDVGYEVIQTALTFIECGMNASLAAKRLYVHRNTFNYRLNAFICKTGIDIRDYDNANLFDLYIKQNAIK